MSLDLPALAAECAPWVHPVTLAAVVAQESGGDPLAVGVNRGGPRVPRPQTLEAAAETVVRLQAQGANFDAGLGQINSANFAALGLTERSVFDPCVNLAAAGALLSECYARALRTSAGPQALDGALSCYNTGRMTAGVTNGYVGRVRARVAVPSLAEAAPPPPPPVPSGLPDAFARGAPDAFALPRIAGGGH